MTNKKMTNRQAMGVLDGLRSNPLFGETHRQAFEIGIKAIKTLDQESCDDWHDVPSDEMTLRQARQSVKDLRKKLAECLEQEPRKGHWEWLTEDKYRCLWAESEDKE